MIDGRVAVSSGGRGQRRVSAEHIVKYSARASVDLEAADTTFSYRRLNRRLDGRQNRAASRKTVGSRPEPGCSCRAIGESRPVDGNRQMQTEHPVHVLYTLHRKWLSSCCLTNAADFIPRAKNAAQKRCRSWQLPLRWNVQGMTTTIECPR